MAESTKEAQEAQDAQENYAPIFDGMVFAINDEAGPELKFNHSSLDERQAIATAIQGITAVGLGDAELSGLFGPLPVPYNRIFNALVYIFHVPSLEFEGTDLYCYIFIIFRKTMMRYVANVYAMIESLFKMYQENYLTKETDLQTKTMQEIYDTVIGTLRVKPKFRLFRVEKGITTEFEEKNVIISNELTIFIHVLEGKIYGYYKRTLDKELKATLKAKMHQLNEMDYQGSFEVIRIPSRKALIALLKKHGITIINV